MNLTPEQQQQQQQQYWAQAQQNYQQQWPFNQQGQVKYQIDIIHAFKHALRGIYSCENVRRYQELKCLIEVSSFSHSLRLPIPIHQFTTSTFIRFHLRRQQNLHLILWHLNLAVQARGRLDRVKLVQVKGEISTVQEIAAKTSQIRIGRKEISEAPEVAEVAVISHPIEAAVNSHPIKVATSSHLIELETNSRQGVSKVISFVIKEKLSKVKGTFHKT